MDDRKPLFFQHSDLDLCFLIEKCSLNQVWVTLSYHVLPLTLLRATVWLSKFLGFMIGSDELWVVLC